MLQYGHFAIAHVRHFAIDHPVDMALAHFRFHQAFGIAHAAQPHMPDIGLAGDEGHRHLVAQLALAQVGSDDPREFIGRAEAARARHRADHHRAGILHKFLIRLPCLRRMRRGADRLREATVRPGAGHFFKGEFGAGANQQVVVINTVTFAGHHRIACRIDLRHAATVIANAVFAHVLAHRQGDLVLLAPPHRQPRIGGREAETLAKPHQRDVMPFAQHLAQLVCRAHTAKPCPHHDKLRHCNAPMSCHVGILEH